MVSTITLRIDSEEIPVQALHHKVGAFLDVLRNVERNVADERAEASTAATTWVVKSIRAESPVVMTLRPDSLSDAPAMQTSDMVVAAVTAGLKEIQSATPLHALPHFFSMPVLESVRDLLRPIGGGPSSVTVTTPEESVPLTSQASVNLSRFLRPAFQHDGSIEGVLEMVSVAGPKPRFSVKDRLTGRAIRCTVPQDQLRNVLQVFGHRVAVSGRVSTNELGDVLSIRVEQVEAFPAAEDLPSIKQVAGAFDLTGGKTPREHLASLRDAS